MIVTIAEHFTSDPSDRERSPAIIWKPGLKPSFHMIVDDRYDHCDRSKHSIAVIVTIAEV